MTMVAYSPVWLVDGVSQQKLGGMVVLMTKKAAAESRKKLEAKRELSKMRKRLLKKQAEADAKK